MCIRDRLFADPAHYPYFSVCTTSTHDMNPLRAWWEENRELSERFYREVLGMAVSYTHLDVYKRQVYATHGNLNNHSGVPLTLLAMTRDT